MGCDWGQIQSKLHPQGQQKLASPHVHCNDHAGLYKRPSKQVCSACGPPAAVWEAQSAPSTQHRALQDTSSPLIMPPTLKTSRRQRLPSSSEPHAGDVLTALPIWCHHPKKKKKHQKRKPHMLSTAIGYQMRSLRINQINPDLLKTPPCTLV